MGANFYCLFSRFFHWSKTWCSACFCPCKVMGLQISSLAVFSITQRFKLTDICKIFGFKDRARSPAGVQRRRRCGGLNWISRACKSNLALDNWLELMVPIISIHQKYACCVLLPISKAARITGKSNWIWPRDWPEDLYIQEKYIPFCL